MVFGRAYEGSKFKALTTSAEFQVAESEDPYHGIPTNPRGERQTYGINFRRKRSET